MPQVSISKSLNKLKRNTWKHKTNTRKKKETVFIFGFTTYIPPILKMSLMPGYVWKCIQAAVQRCLCTVGVMLKLLAWYSYLRLVICNMCVSGKWAVAFQSHSGKATDDLLGLSILVFGWKKLTTVPSLNATVSVCMTVIMKIRNKFFIRFLD